MLFDSTTSRAGPMSSGPRMPADFTLLSGSVMSKGSSRKFCMLLPDFPTFLLTLVHPCTVQMHRLESFRGLKRRGLKRTFLTSSWDRVFLGRWWVSLGTSTSPFPFRLERRLSHLYDCTRKQVLHVRDVCETHLQCGERVMWRTSGCGERVEWWW